MQNTIKYKIEFYVKWTGTYEVPFKKQYSYKHTHIHVALYSVPLKIMLQHLDYCRFDMQTRVARNWNTDFLIVRWSALKWEDGVSGVYGWIRHLNAVVECNSI